jgi:hypothetical protein
MFVQTSMLVIRRKFMHSLKTVFTGIGAVLLAFPAIAQDTATNAPATVIENFEQQTDTVIVKSSNPIGTIIIGSGVLSVRAKESNDVNHSQKIYGIAIGWNGGNSQPGNPFSKGFLVVDYDELDSFISGINYISNVTYDVTSMPTFEVSFTTRSGIRIIAHSDRRQGGINAFLQLADWQKIQLNSDQLAQLKSLVSQAKSSLDAIK